MDKKQIKMNWIKEIQDYRKRILDSCFFKINEERKKREMKKKTKKSWAEYEKLNNEEGKNI